ncbi:MAG: MATE family efflux transporter [Deltaproteobacteria bacterium]|nr:MATE family efflux transporter [Deltaproteobacteria bacterium]MBW2047462.1 MATE family efflux transporter [Deltaproteobacteria bacterium]MBW2110794.1 MATE family efflux transporter [Deltaproteobacteria bacterium]MBW2352180.1 MATE family efflux transporter [Deltaproteobacteria bacterium]HDZ90741.1 MATE family efflux transporter [Deltaproteobacteria bacterium]
MRYLTNRWKGEGGYREFFVIAVPLILSTGAWSVQHFVDRMFLSWYSAEAIAASLPAGILNFCVMSLFIGTASYVSTFVAQYYGAEKDHRIGPAIWQGIYVSILGGIVLICLIPFARPIFGLVGHDPLTQRYEVEYFQILCAGAWPPIASTALSGFFSGRGRTWPVMWVNAVSMGLNLIMDYALIFGRWGLPEMGIRGAAVATVLAGIFSFLAFLAIISTPEHDRRYRTIRGWRPDKALLFRLLRFGFPSGVQFFLDMAGITMFILLVGRLGTVSLAATNIALNISTLAFMPMIGSGIAISVLVGQYLGRNRPDLAQTSVYSGFHMAFLYMGLIALCYLVIPDIFIMPFAARSHAESFSEIYRITVILLRFVALYSVFDTLNLIFSSAIKGAGDTRFVMYAVVMASLFILVIPTYLAVVVLGYGLMVPWITFSAYMIVLGFIFFLRFKGGRWKSMRVIEGTTVKAV